MAKKSKNQTGLIINIVVIVLAILTICTLFMPVFKSTATVLGSSSYTNYTGSQVISAMFKGEVDILNLDSQVNTLISLKLSEDAGFVTTVFMWSYFITIIASAAALVFAVLSILGLRFKLLNTIVGVALVILSIVTFIFAIVTAGKFASADLGSLASSKTVISIAIYLLIGSLIAGGAEVYNARK